jgi:hypothetical protein
MPVEDNISEELCEGASPDAEQFGSSQRSLTEHERFGLSRTLDQFRMELNQLAERQQRLSIGLLLLAQALLVVLLLLFLWLVLRVPR